MTLGATNDSGTPGFFATYDRGVEWAATAGLVLNIVTDVLRAAVEPPAAEKAPAVDELRARLAEAAALTRAGRYQDARAMLDTASSEVEAIGYEPLRTELELELPDGSRLAARTASLPFVDPRKQRPAQ